MARLLRWLPVVLIPLLFLAALWAIAHELAQHRPHDIWVAVHRLPLAHLLLAVALTVASYGVLTL
jgi:uncharacterized membrane protein YbhN (UPF0104 family)